MRAASLDVLRCPATGGALTIDTEDSDVREATLASGDRTYAVRDGIVHLVHPAELGPSDADVQAKYDVGAEDYDSGIQWMWQAFSSDEDTVRAGLIDLMELEPGMRVLETGSGTGQDSWRIVERIGDEGELYAQDISVGMLQVARKRLAEYQTPVELIVGNGSYLPFADGAFDAAYHFGGINTFDERPRAIAEMARVVRPGGKVVIGDEGIAPWQRHEQIGRMLIDANPLYAHEAPLAELPQNALETRIQWIISNAFYVIDFRVGSQPPPVDVDLPIPGPRGGTLRTRYSGQD